MLAPRSFLLSVHEPGSAVLEDLSTRERVHVTDLEEVAARVAAWLDADHGGPGDPDGPATDPSPPAKS